jgi:hypothetical protein
MNRAGEDHDMSAKPRGVLIEAATWLLFPLVPALLSRWYYQEMNPSQEDPRLWSSGSWVILLGPLCGFGFLAGSTVGLSNDPIKRGLRRWISHSAIWVGVGPWLGFIFAIAIIYISVWLLWLVERLFGPVDVGPVLFGNTWWLTVYFWFALLTSSYGWLIVAVAALRRARRAGRLWAAVRRGTVTALAFVGSLFGSFWAATEAWRSYFFDKAIAPLIILAVCLTTLSGCGSTLTVGEVRRRDLFAAMLTAWVLGLALVWRWWARARSKPPTP